jgi:uncharacterized phage-associated protein
MCGSLHGSRVLREHVVHLRRLEYAVGNIDARNPFPYNDLRPLSAYPTSVYKRTPTMFLPFDRTKAVQAAAVATIAEGSRVGKLRLLKLLYIADRSAIRDFGRPILGAKAVAMDHGPLHSEMLNMINGTLPNTREWDRHFKRSGPREIHLSKAPDNGTLSRHEVELLQEIVARHEKIDDWALSQLTHEFPEWKLHINKGTSTHIPLEDIIDAVGRREDKESILADLRDDMAFDSFFAKCAT